MNFRLNCHLVAAALRLCVEPDGAHGPQLCEIGRRVWGRLTRSGTRPIKSLLTLGIGGLGDKNWKVLGNRRAL